MNVALPKCNTQHALMPIRPESRIRDNLPNAAEALTHAVRTPRSGVRDGCFHPVRRPVIS